MALPAGTRFGNYEITAALGAGGMGAVYRARDTRLQRDVALKLLTDAFASDADRRRRFLQEAHALGALNHPNILSIYDVHLEGDSPFIVTELLDGRTLRDEIQRGALPVSKALDLGAQIAAGLQAAHSVGLVHRDLKPENVMVTRDGRVKIVDFGLAKAVNSSPGISVGATQTQTEAGLVLGTVPYMSPQQARGEAVDFRSDQFSFALILYEMLSGTHPFRRETSVQTMSAIIAEDARPIGEVNPKTPVPLQWIMERCLAKDPAARYAATADLARDMATLNLRWTDVSRDGLAFAPQRRRGTLLAIAVTAIAVGIATTLWFATRPVPNTIANYRFTPLVTSGIYQNFPAWSPDGKSLAYVSQVDGVNQVFTRSLASSSQPAQLTHSGFNSSIPFWSADSARIYFHSPAEDTLGLWAVSAAGGEPELIRKNVVRSSITPDGRTLVFFERIDTTGLEGMRLMSASPPQGEAVPVLSGNRVLDAGVADGWLRFSPDGRKVLVWVYPGVYADGGPGRADPFWVIDWPAKTFRTVFTSIAARTLSGATTFGWMPDSRNAVLSFGDPGTTAQHLWMGDTRRDTLWPITSTPGMESFPAVSPEGQRLAFASHAVDFDLIELPLDGTQPRNLLATSRNEFDPAWVEEKKQFVFATDRSGTLELWVRNVDADREWPLVTGDMFPNDATLTLGPIAVSRDGKSVAFQRLGERTGYDVFVTTTAAAGPPVKAAGEKSGLIGDGVADAPSWSPRGDWLAMRFQGKLVKRRFPNGEPVVLATDMLRNTRIDWSPDGRAIVYMSSEGLSIVPADSSGPAQVISADTWFSYVWSSDSRRVIGVREQATARRFMLVAIDPVTGRETILNRDLGIIPAANEPIRGLARKGSDAVVTSIARAHSEIWMLEDFARPRGLFGLGR